MSEIVDYMTVVDPVHEVTLIGDCDFAVWETVFQQENLTRADTGDKIEVILSAVETHYMGFLFREFSISLRLSEHDYFLAHAYNSLWIFAFAERFFFQTPYYHADLIVAPHHIAVTQNQRMLFEARLPDTTSPIQQGAEIQNFKIWLPRQLRKSPDTPHYFYAKLEGDTEHYPSKAVLVNFPAQGHAEIFDLLHESNFTVRDWAIRKTARHSKSKTMQS